MLVSLRLDDVYQFSQILFCLPKQFRLSRQPCLRELQWESNPQPLQCNLLNQCTTLNFEAYQVIIFKKTLRVRVSPDINSDIFSQSGRQAARKAADYLKAPMSSTKISFIPSRKKSAE